ncbi:hypothetical protein HHI36_005071, partial [Cryptolaemus montrouzieri]
QAHHSLVMCQPGTSQSSNQSVNSNTTPEGREEFLSAIIHPLPKPVHAKKHHEAEKVKSSVLIDTSEKDTLGAEENNSKSKKLKKEQKKKKIARRKILKG